MIGADTCDWCGTETNNIQMKSGNKVSLCPSCCPDINENEIPEDIPPQWHFMSKEEREAWLNEMSVNEIMDEFNWHKQPERKI